MENLSILSLIAIVGVILFVFFVGAMLAKMYRKANPERALIRTGLGGGKVVTDGGVFVIPVLHQIGDVNLQTLRLEVQRKNQDALITRDRLRVDVRAEFYVRVAKTVDAIMVAAFAPLVGLLLGISAITVPWDTLFTSVVLYIVIPVILAQVWRKALLANGQAAFDAAMEKIGPWSIAALLVTLVLLFAFQGEAILSQPLVIALLAVPILIQVFFNSALAYWLNRAVGEKHNVACPSALIGASNFFELAVAAAIGLFGFESGAALATVVGVLIEVPVMLLVVRVVNASKGWYERA